MWTIAAFLALSSLVCCAFAQNTTSSAVLPTATSRLGLNHVAKAAGKKYFGTATNNDEITGDAPYATVLNNSKIFGQLTPANSMKWVRLLWCRL